MPPAHDEAMMTMRLLSPPLVSPASSGGGFGGLGGGPGGDGGRGGGGGDGGGDGGNGGDGGEMGHASMVTRVILLPSSFPAYLTR